MAALPPDGQADQAWSFGVEHLDQLGGETARRLARSGNRQIVERFLDPALLMCEVARIARQHCARAIDLEAEERLR